MNAKLHRIVFGLILIAGSASAQDRFSLAQQPQIYLIHNTAKYPFMIEGVSHRKAPGIAGDIMIRNESARVQQRLDLRDPIPYLKDRLSERLRQELGLTNLQVLPDASDLTILPEKLSEEQREAKTPTFQQKYPTGAVIEVVTRQWGIDDFKMKYYASVWLTDLSASKVLMSGSCSWVIFDQINPNRIPLPTAMDAKTAEAIEGELWGSDGVLVKGNLRKAAELCADKIVGRFIGKGAEMKVTLPEPR